MGRTPRGGRMCTWDRKYYYILAHIRPLNHPRAKYLFRFAVCSAQQMLYIKFSHQNSTRATALSLGFNIGTRGPNLGSLISSPTRILNIRTHTLSFPTLIDPSPSPPQTYPIFKQHLFSQQWSGQTRAFLFSTPVNSRVAPGRTWSATRLNYSNPVLPMAGETVLVHPAPTDTNTPIQMPINPQSYLPVTRDHPAPTHHDLLLMENVRQGTPGGLKTKAIFCRLEAIATQITERVALRRSSSVPPLGCQSFVIASTPCVPKSVLDISWRSQDLTEPPYPRRGPRMPWSSTTTMVRPHHTNVTWATITMLVLCTHAITCFMLTRCRCRSDPVTMGTRPSNSLPPHPVIRR